MTSATPPDTPRRWLRYLDIGLALLVVAFIVVVIVHTASQVAMVWPYLLLHAVHYHLARLALALALVMLALAIYIGIIRKGDVTPLFRRATYIIFGTLALQALIGVIMWLVICVPPGQDVHIIYGAGSVLALPFFIFVETTARKRPAMGSYIWGFALVAGIVLRSIMTGAAG